MGFIQDIRRILALLPRERQNLLFSATFSDDIRKLAATFLKDPATVEVAPRNVPIELVSQRVHRVPQERKRALLSHLVKSQDWKQVLVFARTKHGANRLAEQLQRDAIDADAIHGNKSQNARTRALARFKANELQVLVATDVAARGLDIDALPHVVNYDLPHVAGDYVHRIGRTGRAGATGEAISLVSPDERPLLAAIEKLIGRRIEQQEVTGFEPGAAPSRPARAAEEQRPAGRPRVSANKRPAPANKRPASGNKRPASRPRRDPVERPPAAAQPAAKPSALMRFGALFGMRSKAA
jgi:ATP-dependent RNA helicase RhlE